MAKQNYYLEIIVNGKDWTDEYGNPHLEINEILFVGDIIDLRDVEYEVRENLIKDFGTDKFIIKQRRLVVDDLNNKIENSWIDLFIEPYKIEFDNPLIEEKGFNEPSAFKLKIDKLPLSKATITMLQNQEIHTVRDLVAYTENGIENIKFMKSIGVQDIKKALSNMGLRLGMKTYQL